MFEPDDIEVTINLGIVSIKLKSSLWKKLQSITVDRVAEFFQSLKNVQGCYYIVAKHSGKCIDVEDRSLDKGAKIQQWTYWNSENQQWFLVKAERQYYYIISKHSGLHLDIEGGKKEEGAKLIQWTFQGQHHQQWELKDAGEGCYYIISRHSGKYLDVEGYGFNDGAKVQQWNRNPSDNQRWKLEAVA